jgi:hypothetical protein
MASINNPTRFRFSETQTRIFLTRNLDVSFVWDQWPDPPQARFTRKLNSLYLPPFVSLLSKEVIINWWYVAGGMKSEAPDPTCPGTKYEEGKFP